MAKLQILRRSHSTRFSHRTAAISARASIPTLSSRAASTTSAFIITRFQRRQSGTFFGEASDSRSKDVCGLGSLPHLLRRAARRRFKSRYERTSHGVIGGSGLYRMEGFTETEERESRERGQVLKIAFSQLSRLAITSISIPCGRASSGCARGLGSDQRVLAVGLVPDGAKINNQPR